MPQMPSSVPHLPPRYALARMINWAVLVVVPLLLLLVVVVLLLAAVLVDVVLVVAKGLLVAVVLEPPGLFAPLWTMPNLSASSN
jgi:hypothetical protein